jgi:hypothetical protein
MEARGKVRPMTTCPVCAPLVDADDVVAGADE